MTLREKIETMEAFERGEEIELKQSDNDWIVHNSPSWDWINNSYRIKPKPKKVVAIEKWLIKDCINAKIFYRIVELQQGFINDMIEVYDYDEKVKLLDTYEVEI